jgi:hypothetical protein
MISVQNENVTAFLNVSKAGLAVDEMPASLEQSRFKAGECPAGKYAAGGIGECTPCAPGRAAPKGSSNCTDCEAGTYAAETGESTCKECPIGYYQAEKERTVCLQCRPQAITLDNGTSSVADCVCESNPAGPEVCKKGKCDKCPLSAECEQAGTLQSLIAEPGYWRAINSTTVFRPCPKLGQCGGGQIVNGSRDAQCAKGYVGVRCELCDYDSGYALHQPGESCSKCKPNEGRDTLILALCAVVLVVLFVAITTYGCWPQKLNRLLRTRKVMIVKGKYAGRKGKLTKMKNGGKELDELHSATGALKHLYTVTMQAEDGHNQAEVLVLVRGEYLRLCSVNFQEAYQSRVTKIKISWQFVQICLRLNGTYRFPLPRLTIELLNYLKFLELLDIVQILMNMDCLRHVTYVEKLYLHTVLCCLVIAFTVLVMQRRRFERLEKVLSRRCKASCNISARKPNPGSGKIVPRDAVAAEMLTSTMEGILAAKALQNWYRRLKILRKIDTLRQRLLRKLDTERSLSSSDFLLLFSYAVYSGLCDICFGYFDCHRYEDGETYLVPDVSIKCDDSVYLDAKSYAVFTSLLFPLGIPVCYMAALLFNHGVICSRLESILKDKDYVTAFALASKRSCFVDDQKTAWKIRIAKGATKHAGRVGVLTVRRGTVNQEKVRKFSQQRKQGVLWWMWAGQAEKGVPLMDCINIHGTGTGKEAGKIEEVRLHEAKAKHWQGFAVKKNVLTAHVPRKDLLVQLRMGNVPKMAGDELMKAKQEAVDEWTRDNPEMARFLSGKDYKSQFESLRARVGYQKAKRFIQHKARDTSLIAHRYKFLWGPYDVGRWYFEVLDMVRRFLVIGLPQVLRAVAPNAGIQIYIGLLVLSVSPVAYSAMDPYKDRNEQRLMIFTQLASTVVVLCGMVYDKIGPGSVSNWIVTVIILVALCPVLLVLLFFVFYPNGRDRRLLFKRWSDRIPACCSRRAHAVLGAWNDLQGVLRRIGQENEQVGNAVDAAIASIKDVVTWRKMM